MDRVSKLRKLPFLTTLTAIILGFAAAFVILAAAGYAPVDSIRALVEGIFSSPKYLSNVVIKSTPLIITGAGIAFAYKTGLFNIGAEGQFIVGCAASTVTGIVCDFHPVLQIPAVLLAGVCAGAVYGGIVGILKAKFGIHEVLSSIMLNWTALYLSNYICNMDRFHKPETLGTYPIHPSGYTMILGRWKLTKDGKRYFAEHEFLRNTILKTDVNIGIIAAVILAVLLSVFLYRTAKGFELRAVGANRPASELAGIQVNKSIVFSMLVSGGICGLAGALYITGNSPHGIATLAAFENTGFHGLAVCLIAASSPIGCIFAGLLFGGLLYGGQAMQYQAGVPSEIINIVIGMMVFFIALTSVMPRFAVFRNLGGKEHVK